MIYSIFKPSPYLHHIIDRYWYLRDEANGVINRHFPTPLLQCLIFNLFKHQEYHVSNKGSYQLDKDAYFFGQPTSSRLISIDGKGVKVLGVRFKPLGIARLTGINMEYMAENNISAESLWGRELDILCDGIQSATTLKGSISVLEKFLLRKSNEIKLHHRVNSVEHALALIKCSNGAVNAQTLQYETNTSRKTLERAFENYLGISPKLYSEITRFNKVRHYLDQETLNQNLSGLAYDLGYADGSHLSAEFKRFSNISPGEYLKGKGSSNMLNF